MALRIKASQIARLRADAHDRYLRLLFDHVARLYPEVTVLHTADGIRAHNRAAVETAQRLGIRLERDVTRYVEMTWDVGADFGAAPDAHAWARPVLTDHALTGTQKVGRLDTLLTGWPELDPPDDVIDTLSAPTPG